MFGSRLSFSTGMPAVDAREDFARAHRAARVRRWLRGGRRPSWPLSLADSAVRPGRGHLAVIPLDQIVGTVEPSPHFDDRFRPAAAHLHSRWVRIAYAQRTGIALPPIAVTEGPGGYYVLDGRHRVSVARATGRREIEAWVR